MPRSLVARQDNILGRNKAQGDKMAQYDNMAQDELSRLKNSLTLVKRVLRYTLPQSNAKPSKRAVVRSSYLFTKVEMDYHSHRC